MRRYEVCFVLAPTLSPEEVEQFTENFKGVAEDQGASVVDVDNWGKKRLAFPVKKHSEGYYIILTLDEEAATASTELERRFKVTDAVIRFLTIRIDGQYRRAEKLKAKQDLRRPKAEAAKDEPGATQPAKPEEAPVAEKSATADSEKSAEATAPATSEG